SRILRTSPRWHSWQARRSRQTRARLYAGETAPDRPIQRRQRVPQGASKPEGIEEVAMRWSLLIGAVALLPGVVRGQAAPAGAAPGYVVSPGCQAPQQ